MLLESQIAILIPVRIEFRVTVGIVGVDGYRKSCVRQGNAAIEPIWAAVDDGAVSHGRLIAVLGSCRLGGTNNEKAGAIAYNDFLCIPVPCIAADKVRQIARPIGI